MNCCFVFEKFQIKMITLYLLLNTCVIIIYVFFKIYIRCEGYELHQCGC